MKQAKKIYLEITTNNLAPSLIKDDLVLCRFAPRKVWPTLENYIAILTSTGYRIGRVTDNGLHIRKGFIAIDNGITTTTFKASQIRGIWKLKTIVSRYVY